MACLVTLFDRKLQCFKNSPKWAILDIFKNFCPLKTLQVNFHLTKMIENAKIKTFKCDILSSFQTVCEFLARNFEFNYVKCSKAQKKLGKFQCFRTFSYPVVGATFATTFRVVQHLFRSVAALATFCEKFIL